MDFNAKVAELEVIVRRYRNCVACREYGIALEVLTEWRQATNMALESAYVEGYDLAASQIREKAE
jgi:hypothetical protein